ncbi:MAG: universal stress protein [Senegalia sp. (in: firmicutes)]|uniref:universal stress protein n=1 Tax=Senegalia sp. (in: firmicutes) TaxID=1924098 RepID=UPI003F9AD209
MKEKKIMVCVTQQKNCERLIKFGNDSIKENKDGLYVIHVVNENDTFLNKNNDGEALEYLFGVSKAVGANLTVIRSKNLSEAIIKFIKEQDITHIVMGESPDEGNKNDNITNILKKELPSCNFSII